ncbi:MAG: hypothetical protein R2780_07785 [Crocinitomicaceae bacterium]
MTEKTALIFPIKTGLEYIETSPLGLTGTGSQGASHYAAENPPFGVTFTYYVKDKPKSPKNIRQENEKQVKKDGGNINYPTYEDFVKEDTYEDPYLLFIIKDANGNEVRKMKSGAQTGVNRVTWNMRYPTTTPLRLKYSEPGRYSYPDEGPLALPGKYTVELHMAENGIFTKLADPVGFEIKALENSSLARQTESNIAFKQELSELRRQYRGTNSVLNDLENRLKFIKAAIQQYPDADLAWMTEVKAIEGLIHDINIALNGDWHKSSRDVETVPSVGDRIETIVYQCWYSTSDPTTTQKDQYAIAKEDYARVKLDVDKVQARVIALEEKLNANQVPYTPNRINFKED